MSRKNRAPRKIFYPDTKYASTTLAKFINFIMYDGKKTTAEKIIYDALDEIKNKTKQDPIKVFNDAISNIRPNLEVRSRRVGGATYQVPVEVRDSRSEALAMRWLLGSARARKNIPMTQRLAMELMDAAKGEGSAIKRREDMHRMAEANRAFVHYRW